jgi:hypothetical protein
MFFTIIASRVCKNLAAIAPNEYNFCAFFWRWSLLGTLRGSKLYLDAVVSGLFGVSSPHLPTSLSAVL